MTSDPPDSLFPKGTTLGLMGPQKPWAKRTKGALVPDWEVHVSSVGFHLHGQPYLDKLLAQALDAVPPGSLVQLAIEESKPNGKAVPYGPFYFRPLFGNTLRAYE
jgi:hypothetical protein